MSKLPIKAISVAEARVRLEKLKPKLDNLKSLYEQLVVLEQQLADIESNEEIATLLAARNEITIKEDELIDLQQVFHDNDCVIKDVSTGLIDFVAVRKGKLVWLCYRTGEGQLEYYHDWEAGFVGRKAIDFQ